MAKLYKPLICFILYSKAKFACYSRYFLTSYFKRKAREKGKLHAEFQRIARRDKKAFLSEQCKEIEENSRMGKTRDCFKKIGRTSLVV